MCKHAQTCTNPTANEVSEGGYKNLALLDPPNLPSQVCFLAPNGGKSSLSQSSHLINGKREVSVLGKQWELFV